MPFINISDRKKNIEKASKSSGRRILQMCIFVKRKIISGSRSHKTDDNICIPKILKRPNRNITKLEWAHEGIYDGNQKSYY